MPVKPQPRAAHVVWQKIAQNGSLFARIAIIRGSAKYWADRRVESKFTNACTKSIYFKSMVEKANLGDETANRLVNAYHYRPEVEFFDIQSDPLELNNLALNPAYQSEIKRLSLELEKWMSSQGDDGVGTEMRAQERQSPKRKKNKYFPSTV